MRQANRDVVLAFLAHGAPPKSIVGAALLFLPSATGFLLGLHLENVLAQASQSLLADAVLVFDSKQQHRSPPLGLLPPAILAQKDRTRHRRS